MGGPGSSRWGDYKKRNIVEHSLVLSIDAFVKAGLDPTCEGSGSVTLPSPKGAPVETLLNYQLDLSFGEPLFFYSLKDDWLTGQIRLQKTSPHFGRVRWWLTCPSPSTRWCSQRVGRLYPLGPVKATAGIQGTRIGQMKRSSQRLAKTSALAVRTQPLQGVCLSGGVDQFAERIGGKKTFIDMCRWSQTPPVKELVRQWDGLSREEQDSTPLDDLCQRFGLDTHQLIQEAVSSFSWLQSIVAQVKCAMALPHLMDASIQAALRQDLIGLKEQELHFMMAGFLGDGTS
jgi:hypothetical protein